MGVTMTVDRLGDVLKSVSALANKEVLVGVPAKNAERTDADAPISNAEIGYLMETGSPANNIPARPHLVPGVASVQGDVAAELRKAGVAALTGATSAVDAALSRAGLIGQKAVRAKITEGPFVPLSESTLRARARRGRKGAARELERMKEAQGSGADFIPDPANAKPLIDTGQYRQSVVYVVRKK